MVNNMNERIQELAKQSNAWYPGGYPSAEGDDAAWQNLVIFNKEDLEKFALTIIQECATIADTAEPYKSSDLILKHFGVK